MGGYLSDAEVRHHLEETFGPGVASVEPVPSGQISRGFFFEVDGRGLVARFSGPGMGFLLRKDQLVSSRLVANGIPVPVFVRIDDIGEHTCAVTERIDGQPLDNLTPDEYAALLPELIRLLDVIHGSDVGGLKGYGSIDAHGGGAYPTWSASMASIAEEEAQDDERLIAETVLEGDLLERLCRELTDLLPICPEERRLVHADYAFDNVLALGGRITAVLDWSNAMYGDSLFDVARLAMLQPEHDFAGRFEHYYRTEGRDVTAYRERLRCYACYNAIDMLRFYACTKQVTAYGWARGLVLDFLGD